MNSCKDTQRESGATAMLVAMSLLVLMGLPLWRSTSAWR